MTIKSMRDIIIFDNVKKNFSFLKNFIINIAIIIAIELCLANDDITNPKKNIFLFLLSIPIIAIIDPKIKKRSVIIRGLAI